MDGLLWLNAETLKRVPTPLWQTCKVLCLWVLFHETTVGVLSILARLCLMHVHVTMPQCSHWELLINEAVDIETLYSLTWYGHF